MIVPGWEDGVEYEVQRFKGSFGLQSAFTGIGPEVDAVWDNITDGTCDYFSPSFVLKVAVCGDGQRPEYRSC